MEEFDDIQEEETEETIGFDGDETPEEEEESLGLDEE